jgi:SecD/SecF fusion protein
VFDRIRENVPRMPRATFSQIVNRSMSEVLTRSLATSASTLMPIGALLLFGGETLQDFAFALLVGVASGAYSSIFIAAPVLTLWKEREPVYVRRRKIVMEENGGIVPPFASGVLGDGEDGAEAPAKRRKPQRQTPVPAGPTPATAGGAPASAAPHAPPAAEPSGGGDGNGALSESDSAAAERKAQRARNRARRKHGRH